MTHPDLGPAPSSMDITPAQMDETCAEERRIAVTPNRRSADSAPPVLLMESTSATGAWEEAGFMPLDAAFSVAPIAVADRLARTTVVIYLPDDELLVVPMAGAHILPRGTDHAERRRRAAAAAIAWRRERHRLEWRSRMPDWLMVYVDELNAARTIADVPDALIACAPLVLGAYTALVLVRNADAEDPPVIVVQDASRTVVLPDLPAAAVPMASEITIISEVEAHAHGYGPHSSLSPVFVAFSAAHLVCAPVADGLWLVLVERRRDRVFTADERDALQWLVKQARRCLARLGAAEADRPDR